MTSLVLVASLLGVSEPETDSRLRAAEPGSNSGRCGAVLTLEDAAEYLDSRLEAERVDGPLYPPPYCVPIAGHIVRTSAGTGGIPVSQYAQAILDANRHFANTGIVFYSLTLDYIDDDFFYAGMSTADDVNTLRGINVVARAINCYFTPFVLPGVCGLASFSFTEVQGIVMNNYCTGLPSDPSTFSHELGHYFNLLHTHETVLGVEFVDGSNCTTAGDLICDTPADPYLVDKVSSRCVYTGNEYDPNGDPYDPDVTQQMSYAPPYCRDVFSPQSEAAMLKTLFTARTDLLARGCGPARPSTVSAVTPPRGFQDQTLDIILHGTNLRHFTSVLVEGDVAVNSVDTLSTRDSLAVNITIGPEVAPGPRDVVVTNGLDPDTLKAGLEIVETRRHYVSAEGANHYPYARPQDAALSLKSALAAARAGDSVLVDSTAVNVGSLSITKPIVLSGGWADSFTHRDPSVAKTPLDLNGNILIIHPGQSTTIDGFVLQNGNGTVDVTPVPGRYGGALRVIEAAATIANCEMRANTAGPAGVFGGGGAVYAADANIAVENCYIHDNHATRGGALYLFRSTARLTHNTIEHNTVAAGDALPPEGAGIAVEECSSVIVTGNVVRNNVGAYRGGGIWVANAGPVTVAGGELCDHSAVNNGAGAYATGSSLLMNEVTCSRNASSLFGGAVAAEDSSIVFISKCLFGRNAAFGGAGVMVSGGDAFVANSLFVGNSASFSGGAIYLGSTRAGAVIGNTIDRNAGSMGAGGAFLVDASIAVLNNIVVNSIGDGLSSTGASPSASYNLVWNSSGSDYVGMSAGPGSLSHDPLFADTSSTDYHLALHSPAIDAGEPSVENLDTDRSRGDMGRFGAHSLAMDQPSYPQGVTVGVANGEVTIAWQPNPEDDVDFYAVYCDTIDGFVPTAENFVGTSSDTALTLPQPSDTTYYRVSAVDTAGYASGYSTQVSSAPVASGIGPGSDLLDQLAQNVPNPFNPTTTIEYAIARRSRVQLNVYDVRGRHVKTLVDRNVGPDSYRVVWDGRNSAGNSVASGVYFYRLVAEGFVATKKMVLLR